MDLQPIPREQISEVYSWRDWFRNLREALVAFPGATSTSATAGTATALPAQPAGYIEIAPGKLVPYYNKS